MPNETWRYGRADGDLLFHFSAGYDDRGGGDLYDYRLVESVLDLRGAADAPSDQLLLSRQSLSPIYGRMLNWGPYGAARARDRERGIGRASIDYGTTTDSYELQFARPLTAYADLVAVGERTACRSRTSCSAIAPPETTAAGRRGRELSGAGARWSRSTAPTTPLRSADTAFVFQLDRPLRRGSTSSGASSSRCRPGTGAGARRSSRATRPASSCRGTACAAAALGPRSPSATWRSASGPASARWLPHPPTPCCSRRSTCSRSGARLRLYYEAAGAVAGAGIGTRSPSSVRGDGRLESRPVVALASTSRAAGPVRARRTLQLGRLKPGHYVVEVELRAPGGPETRRRDILVVETDH